MCSGLRKIVLSVLRQPSSILWEVCHLIVRNIETTCDECASISKDVSNLGDLNHIGDYYINFRSTDKIAGVH